MGFCSFIEKRCNRFYFRMRLPVDLAPILGRSHVVASLQTDDLRLAKQRAARLFLSLAGFLETIRLRMAQTLSIDGIDQNRTEALVLEAFALGQAYEAKKSMLHDEFVTKLRQLIANDRDALPDSGAAMPPAIHLPFLPSEADVLRRHEVPPPPSIPQIPAKTPVSPAWTSLRASFLNDKPGLSEKSLWSYNQAFDAWAGLIGSMAIGDIRRADVKAYADFLRDRPNQRGGSLNHKTIIRSLGHIKTFLAWAVAAGHAVDDRFETVMARAQTREERIAGEKRRAFTPPELTKLFNSHLFTNPKGQEDEAAAWFLTIAALTGARTEEM